MISAPFFEFLLKMLKPESFTELRSIVAADASTDRLLGQVQSKSLRPQKFQVATLVSRSAELRGSTASGTGERPQWFSGKRWVDEKENIYLFRFPIEKLLRVIDFL